MIGGTRFVGRHIARAAVASGHHVTIFTRGRSAPPPDGVEHRVGDRGSDLSALMDGAWDATIDTCAYVPRHVDALADVLQERAGRYLFISSVSVYDVPERPGYREDARLVELDDPDGEEINEHTYGGLKVLCERAAMARFGPGTLLVRPTYVVGPDDYTWRFPWWVQRLSRGGEVLAPGSPEDPAQVIDVRDMATWVVGLLHQEVSGAFHAASPPPPFTWRELLEAIASAVAPAGTTLTWVDEEFCLEAGLDDGSLPLWSGGDPAKLLMAADPAAAIATGLRPRPLGDTVRDTSQWAQVNDQPDDAGLSRAREAQILDSWRRRSTRPLQPPPR